MFEEIAEFSESERKAMTDMANLLYRRVMVGFKADEERRAASDAIRALEWLSEPYETQTVTMAKKPYGKNGEVDQ